MDKPFPKLDAEAAKPIPPLGTLFGGQNPEAILPSGKTLEFAAMYGMGLGKTNPWLQQMKELQKQVKNLTGIKVFHFDIESGSLSKKLLSYASETVYVSEPEKPKAWEAQLPQEREPVMKGFRQKLNPASQKARSKSKLARKARRR